MKHVNVLLKASLILVMALGFLKLEAHVVRAQDTNPPPAVETVGGSSSSTDSSAVGADTGGSNAGGSSASSSASTSSADSSGSSGSSAASDDSSSPAGSSSTAQGSGVTSGESSTSTSDEAASPADSSTSTDDEAASPVDSSTSAGDEAANPVDSSTSADDEAANPADSSTSAGDEAANPADSSTSADDETANPADSSTSADDEAANPADSSTLTSDEAANPADSSTSADDEAANPVDSSTSADDEAANPADSSTSVDDEDSSPSADEILEDAAEKDITLADGDGQPLSAADAETQALLTSTSSDPWFNAGGGVIVGYSNTGGCVAGVTECHANESNSIQAAINDSRSAGRVINIEAGDYSAETFTLNNSTSAFNLAGNISVNTINLNTNYSLVSVFGGFFSALEVFLNFGGPKTATLQQGVNLTQSGGTLNVASKTYNENVTINNTKNGIHVVGHNNPIQDGTGKGPNGFNVLANDVSISGFTIQNNSNAGINVPDHGSVNASDNKFYNNRYGVYLTNGSSAVLSNNTFGDATDPLKGNIRGVAAYGFGGVPLTGYMLTSTGDQFFGNGHGVYLQYGATGSFSGDVFRKNGTGVRSHSNSKADVTGSAFIDNGEGIYSDEAMLSSNSNTYTDNDYGVRVLNNTPGSTTLVYDNFEGNGTGIWNFRSLGGQLQVHYSRFYNNGVAIKNTNSGAGTVNADNNWWGDNQGPSNPGSTSGNVDASDWLALDMSPSDDPIFTGGDTSQLTTQMMSTDGVTRTPLSALDTAGIQGNWFFYSSAPTLQNPSMGTMSGDTFISGSQTGDANFTDTQFDDETPTTKVTVVDAPVPEDPVNPTMPTNPGSPEQPGNSGGPSAPALAPLPQVVIPVTGASLVDLVCGSPTRLLVEDGNSVVIPALEPCTMQASVQGEAEDGLPGPLPDGVQFVDALTVTVANGGNALEVLPQEALMQVVFDDAQAQANAGLAVYWWDGNAWQEVPDSSLGTAASNNTGLFVLVMK